MIFTWMKGVHASTKTVEGTFYVKLIAGFS